MIPVLYYHRIGPFRSGSPRKMTVTPENFRKQMEYLRRRNSAFVRLPKSGCDFVRRRLPGSPRACVADPRGIPDPGDLLRVAGAMGKTNAWYRGEEKILDCSDARELVRRGFSIGAHGLTHTPLHELSPSEALREAVESKRILEDRLGIAVRKFAYPKGRCVPESAREAGYRDAWGTQSATGAPFRRRRFRVSGRTGRLRFAGKSLRIRMGWR